MRTCTRPPFLIAGSLPGPWDDLIICLGRLFEYIAFAFLLPGTRSMDTSLLWSLRRLDRDIAFCSRLAHHFAGAGMTSSPLWTNNGEILWSKRPDVPSDWCRRDETARAQIMTAEV